MAAIIDEARTWNRQLRRTAHTTSYICITSATAHATASTSLHHICFFGQGYGLLYEICFFGWQLLLFGSLVSDWCVAVGRTSNFVWISFCVDQFCVVSSYQHLTSPPRLHAPATAASAHFQCQTQTVNNHSLMRTKLSAMKPTLYSYMDWCSVLLKFPHMFATIRTFKCSSRGGACGAGPQKPNLSKVCMSV